MWMSSFDLQPMGRLGDLQDARLKCIGCPSQFCKRTKRQGRGNRLQAQQEGNAFLKGSVTLATAILNAAKLREPDKRDVSFSHPASLQDVKHRLEKDYIENQYFVTGYQHAGNVDEGLYTDDCLFADPTISFRGRSRYVNNLQTLKGFFVEPSIQLYSLKQLAGEESGFKAEWRLMVELKLPWRPKIDIKGNTTYSIGDAYRIHEHRERWNVSAWEAVLQIFKVNRGSPELQ